MCDILIIDFNQYNIMKFQNLMIYQKKCILLLANFLIFLFLIIFPKDMEYPQFSFIVHDENINIFNTIWQFYV